MGKKRHSTGKTSNGERRSSIGAKVRDPGTRMMNQLDAMRKGKRTRVTMENPNKEETNKQFITVEGKDWFKKEYSEKMNG